MWKSLLVSDAFELQNQVSLKIDKYEVKLEKVLIKKSPKKVIMTNSTPKQQSLLRTNTVTEIPKEPAFNKEIQKEPESNSSPFPMGYGVKQEPSQNSNKSTNLWDYFEGILNSGKKPEPKKVEVPSNSSSNKENNKENAQNFNVLQNNNINQNQSNWKNFSELLPMESQVIIPKRRNIKVIEDLPSDILQEEDKCWEKKKVKTEDADHLQVESRLNKIKIESPVPSNNFLKIPQNTTGKESVQIENYEEEKSTSYNDLSSAEDFEEKKVDHTPTQFEDKPQTSKLKRLKKILDEKREEAAKNSVTKIQSQQLKQENLETCAICLSDITEFIGKLEICIHKFCFTCIRDWSNVTNECPLCKGRFEKIVKCTLQGEVVESIKVEFKRQVYEDNLEEFIDEEVDECCYECQNADDPDVLLICDGCGFYCCHTYCCDPPLESVPLEDWFCKFCTRSRRRGGRRGRTTNNSSNRQTRNNTSNTTRRTNSRTSRNTNSNSNSNRYQDTQPSLLERLFAEAENGFGSPDPFFRLSEEEMIPYDDDHLENFDEEDTNTPVRARGRRNIEESEEISPEKDLTGRRNNRNQNSSRSNTNTSISNRVNRQNSTTVSIDTLNNFRYPVRNHVQRVNS